MKQTASNNIKFVISESDKPIIRSHSEIEIAKAKPKKRKSRKKNLGKGIVSDTINRVKQYAKVVVKGRNDYPPKVRKLLSQLGNQTIKSATLRRTPVPSVLTQALNAVSLGSFGKNLADSPYDKLFHLSIVFTLANNSKVLVEKNEVINMDKNPSTPQHTETKEISNIPNITLDQVMSKTKEKMGDKFLNYSARDNNCQDFILAILQANHLGNQEDTTFVKQETKKLFEGLTNLRKVSNTVTDLGKKVNEITTGAGIVLKKKISDKNISTMPKKNKKHIEVDSDDDAMQGGSLGYGMPHSYGGAIVSPDGMVFMPSHTIIHHYNHHGHHHRLHGGNIKDDFRNAFDPNRNGVTKAFSPGGSAEQFGDKVASSLIHQGIPIATSVLGGVAGEAAGGNPVSGAVGSEIGNQVGNAAADAIGKATGRGIGRKGRFVKGSKEAKEFMASLRAKRKH